MRDLLRILAFALLASASRSTADPAPRHVPVDSLAVRSAAQASNRFGFELFERLRGDDGNLFFSPLSVELALGMTCEGAAGETYQQMRSALDRKSVV